MLILMGVWEGHEPYSAPLDSRDTRGLDWEQADRRCAMFQVLSSDRSTVSGWLVTNCANRAERIMYHG
jgi:hypothetical protein